MRDRRWLGAGTVVLGLALLLLSAGAASAGAAPMPSTTTTNGTVADETITECTTIESSGTYEITEDFNTSSGSAGSGCISITADDVTLDGGNHAIDDTTDVQYGVEAASVSDVVVKDLTLYAFDTGVDFRSVTDSRIADVSTDNGELGTGTGTENSGIRLSGGSNNTVRDSSISYPGDGNTVSAGIEIVNSEDNLIENNDIFAPYFYGVWLKGADRNNITGNTIEDDGVGGNGRAMSSGVRIDETDPGESPSDDNYVYNNDLRGRSLFPSGAKAYGTDGVEVFSGRRTTIEENYIVGFQEKGVVAGDADTSVIDNTLRNTGGEGIWISEPGANVTANLVIRSGQDDDYFGRADGIYVGADDTRVVANEIRFGDGTGLYIDGASSLTVRDGYIHDNEAWAVEVSGTSATLETVRIESGAASITASGADFAITAAPAPTSPTGEQDIGIHVDASSSLRLETTYTDGSVASVDESTLSMWRYSGGSWTEIGGTVDTGANTVAADVSGGGVIAPLAANDPPTASVTVSPSTASVGEVVAFDATSSDPDGQVVEYRWDFDGDGTVDERGSSGRTTHLYATGGTYDAELTVVDDGDDTATTTTAVTVTESAGGEGEAWPEFGYDTANTGHAPNNTGTGGEVVERWRYDTGSEADPHVVSGGVVYAARGDTVYAIHAENGTTKWEYFPGGSDIESLTLRNGILYVGSDFTFTAVYAETGNERWERDDSSFSIDYDTGATELVVTDDRVYADLTDGGIHSVHVSNGSLAPFTEYGDSADSFRTPAVSDGTLYVSGRDDGTDEAVVAALDPADGTVQWEQRETVDSLEEYTSVAVNDSTVYVAGPNSTGNTTYALDADTGSELWSRTFDEELTEAPSVANGTVYVVSGPSFGGGANVTALDAGDGSVTWTTQIAADTSDAWSGSPPAIVDGTVYVGSKDGSVYALNESDGSVWWTEATGGVPGGPVVADGTVYVDNGGTLFALTGRSVLGPENFTTTLDVTNLPVTEGESLRLDATVRNVGGYEGTQTVALATDGTQRDAATLTLAPFESRTVSLTWNTGTDDAGGYTATVASANDSVSLPVTVDPDPPGTPRQFNYCTVIDDPGTYELTADITDTGAETCIEITTSDIVLDGQDHRIDMSGDGDAVAVTAPGASNVTVENLVVRNAQDGIEIGTDVGSSAGGLRVRNTDIARTDDGIVVDLAVTDRNAIVDGLRVRNNAIETASTAVDIDLNGDNATLRNVAIVRNDITVTGDSTFGGAVLLDARDSNQTLRAGVAENAVNATNIGLNVEADTTGTRVELGVVDNVVGGPTGVRGPEQVGVRVETDEDRQNVTVLAQDNTLLVPGFGSGMLIDASGENATLDATIEDNTLDGAEDADGLELDVYGDNATGDIGIHRNEVSASGSSDGLVLDADGEQADLTLGVTDNSFDGSLDLELDGTDPAVDAAIRRNEIDTMPDAGDGIELALADSADGVDVRIASNEIRADYVAVETSGAVAALAVEYNVLVGDDYGIDNGNTTAGFVDATDNFWGDDDGPSSDGPYEDPVTGTLADGSGSEITERSGGVANVRFDPWLRSPGRPNFLVAVDSTTSPVTEGETLAVTATLENDGTSGAVQRVALRTDGTERDATTVTLAPGDTRTVTLEWDTTAGAAASYTAVVRSANDSDSVGVTIDPSTTATATPTPVPIGTGADGPGFGALSAALAVLLAIALARRRG